MNQKIDLRRLSEDPEVSDMIAELGGRSPLSAPVATTPFPSRFLAAGKKPARLHRPSGPRRLLAFSKPEAPLGTAGPA